MFVNSDRCVHSRNSARLHHTVELSLPRPTHVGRINWRLLFSNGSYGDVMPRLVGVFMVALGGAVFEFVRARDYRYYQYAIVARIFIVVALTALYTKARDPLFLVLDAIVLIGLLPSIYVAFLARPAMGSSSQGPAA
jgi:hypothetical protein